MPYKLTTVSHPSTGIKTVSSPFPAKSLRITLGKKGSGVDATNHESVGDYSLDTDYQVVDSRFTDNSGSETRRLVGSVVNHMERVSGSIVQKAAAHVDQVAAPWEVTTPPYNVKYVVDVADVNYQYKVEIFG